MWSNYMEYIPPGNCDSFILLKTERHSVKTVVEIHLYLNLVTIPDFKFSDVTSEKNFTKFLVYCLVCQCSSYCLTLKDIQFLWWNFCSTAHRNLQKCDSFTFKNFNCSMIGYWMLHWYENNTMAAYKWKQNIASLSGNGYALVIYKNVVDHHKGKGKCNAP